MKKLMSMSSMVIGLALFTASFIAILLKDDSVTVNTYHPQFEVLYGSFEPDEIELTAEKSDKDGQYKVKSLVCNGSEKISPDHISFLELYIEFPEFIASKASEKDFYVEISYEVGEHPNSARGVKVTTEFRSEHILIQPSKEEITSSDTSKSMLKFIKAAVKLC